MNHVMYADDSCLLAPSAIGIIYINGLPKSSDMFNILMYADDTTLFCNFDTTCNSEKINSELEKIYRWLCSNKLSLNVGKTKFACFHTAQRIVAYPELKINNFIIDTVTEFNFLGLIVSSNMKWKKTYRSYSTKSFQNHWYNVPFEIYTNGRRVTHVIQ